ncbi:MAG: L-fucose isomerase [Oscillospiraceae bacterium]|jgi:L-fucose isomerase|nr:L-fucose isomerase [Oscillospiraceae bacterium]
MSKPRIGIRPIIDGRQGGVRESLEEKTLQMAQSAKALIEAECFYTDGTPAEVVIAPSTIGGSAEAAAAADLFAAENVIATLSVTPCWCYGSETMDLDPKTIKAVWGFNGTERPGAVYLAAVLAAHAQRGLPAFSIYGHDVQDIPDTTIPADVKEKILRFARCALAVGQMRGKSYVGIGAVSMGIAGSYADVYVLEKYFGLRPEWVDMSEVRRRLDLDIYDPEEYAKARQWMKDNCPEGFDVNERTGKPVDAPADGANLPGPSSKERKEWEWDVAAKMTLICRDILVGNEKLLNVDCTDKAAWPNGHVTGGWKEEAKGRNAILGGFQGQRQWTDYMPNADFTEAILNSSFDWNGAREPLTFATENDGCNGLAMLLGKLVTGTASIFADVRTYWSPDAVKRVTGYDLEGKAAAGLIHLSNSGAAALDGTGMSKDKDGNPGVIKPFWEMTAEDIQGCLSKTDWCQANKGYFRGGGYSSHYFTQYEMPATMIRLNIIQGIGPVLQFVEGWTVTLPAEVEKVLVDRTDPTWPQTWFAPRTDGSAAIKDAYTVMANWGANHGSLTYGHIGKDLITLASMLRIPVALHNVADSDLYRPHAWSAFGTKDYEGADYRACAAYGPLYK